MWNVERICSGLGLGKVGRIIHHFFALRLRDSVLALNKASDQGDDAMDKNGCYPCNATKEMAKKTIV